MGTWFLQPFRLLDSTKSRWQLVFFCGTFGCLFLTVFRPFDMNHWFAGVKTPLFLIIIFFSATGAAALALTQFALRPLFQIQFSTRIHFFGWLLLEFLLVSLAIHVVNYFITKQTLSDIEGYLLTLKYTLLVLGLPYFFCVVFAYVREQMQVVEELMRQTNRPTVPGSITITDENGKMMLNLPSRNILYFKSEDNYVLLHYKIENQLRKELIRTSLKKLEQELNRPNFIRVHRSYMINSQNLISTTKTPRGYQVVMDSVGNVPLPVSSTYQKDFEDKLLMSRP